MRVLRSRYWLWVACGILLGIGFVLPIFWVVGIAGVAYFIHLLQQGVSLKEKLFGAWLAWSIKAGMAVEWIWSTYPIHWLPEEVSSIQLLLIFSTWLTTALCLGTGAVVIVLVAGLLRRQVQVPSWSYYFFLYPLLWIVGEVVGSLVFSAYTYGPGGSIVSAFSYGYVGYLLAEHEAFLQLARLAGVYGLSFLLVLLAGIILYYAKHLKQVWRLVAVCAIALYGVGFVPLFSSTDFIATEGQTVLLIHTEFGSRLGNTALGERQQSAKLEKAVEAAIAIKPEYIILPEDSRYFNQSQSASVAKSLFKTRYNNPELIIVDSGRTIVNSKTVLQSFVYNGHDDTVERFHKRLLVPQGEYVSTLYEKAFRLIGRGAFLDFFAKDLSYEVGPWTRQKTNATKTPGILFCFESFDPLAVRTIAKERPNMPFVAHIASHAWFNEPMTLWPQMETMLQVQAVWNQHYIVSAGNMMPGMLYTPQGAKVTPETILVGDQWKIKKVIIPR